MVRLLLLMTLIIGVSAVEMQERVGLDPVLRGIWVLHGEYRDGEYHPVEHPTEFAVARGLEMTFSNGVTVGFTKVAIIKNESDGSPMNAIYLENGNFMVVDQIEPNRPLFVLQMFDGAQQTEIIKIAIEVTR